MLFQRACQCFFYMVCCIVFLGTAEGAVLQNIEVGQVCFLVRKHSVFGHYDSSTASLYGHRDSIHENAQPACCCAFALASKGRAGWFF